MTKFSARKWGRAIGWGLLVPVYIGFCANYEAIFALCQHLERNVHRGFETGAGNSLVNTTAGAVTLNRRRNHEEIWVLASPKRGGHDGASHLPG
jgi:hypothetical protein